MKMDDIRMKEIMKDEWFLQEATDILKKCIASGTTVSKADSERLCEIVIHFGVSVDDFMKVRSKTVFDKIINKYENNEDGA